MKKSQNFMHTKIILLACLLVIITVLMTVAFAGFRRVPSLGDNFPSAPTTNLPQLQMPDGIVSAIFVESTDGIDDGVSRLIKSMQAHGLNFYQTNDMPNGLITSNDVVILLINAQWAERGGTNTDLIARVTEAILAHPDGFTGEIVISDNGQAQHGTNGRGGSLDWSQPNSACRSRSTLDVINMFQAQGNRVTGSLWDEFTRVRVQEFNYGDFTNGFIVENYLRNTGYEVSYPKFTTEFGTHISFRHGIWNGGSFDTDRLKVINLPVLKSHRIYGQTGAVKGYMGVVSDRQTRRHALIPVGRSHNSVAQGGMGTQMVYTRMPILNIMDMIWIAPDGGPASRYNTAVEINKIAASLDPVALDVWTTNHVLMPEAQRLRSRRLNSMDPAGVEPGTFGHWLRLSLNEMLAAGYNFTMNENEMMVIIAGEN